MLQLLERVLFTTAVPTVIQRRFSRIQLKVSNLSSVTLRDMSFLGSNSYLKDFLYLHRRSEYQENVFSLVISFYVFFE